MSINPDIRIGKQGFEIFQAYEVWPDLCQTRTVVFEKTVVYGTDQGDQLEHNVSKRKRNQKNIAPFIITYDFAAFSFRIIRHCNHFLSMYHINLAGAVKSFVPACLLAGRHMLSYIFISINRSAQDISQ